MVSVVKDDDGYLYYIIGVSLGEEETQKSNQDVYPNWMNKHGELVLGQTMHKVKWLSREIFMIHKDQIPETSTGITGVGFQSLPTESADYLWNLGISQL